MTNPDTTNGPPIGEDDLQAAIDGRLIPQRRAAVEAWLAAHPARAADHAADQDITEQLRARLAPILQLPVPARLRVVHIRAARRHRALARLRGLAASVALLAAGGALGWTANALHAPAAAPGPAAMAAQDAIAAYRVFVVEKLHPVEVRATEEAHLLQWLSRRLGAQLAAPDLSPQGYQLMGGRLLPMNDGRPAAQFMYTDAAGQRLALFACACAAPPATGFERQGGISAATWTGHGLTYVVTAQLDRAELQPLAAAIRAQLAAGPAQAL